MPFVNSLKNKKVTRKIEKNNNKNERQMKKAKMKKLS
jgi:hypothetical protein